MKTGDQKGYLCTANWGTKLAVVRNDHYVLIDNTPGNRACNFNRLQGLGDVRRVEALFSDVRIVGVNDMRYETNK